MAGVVKDWIQYDITPGLVAVATGTADWVEFHAGWFMSFDESAPNKRTFYYMGVNQIEKITVSPKGVAYPGNATVGGGGKKVVLNFIGNVEGTGGAQIIMTGVENVDVTNGWVIIQKGDHVIAYWAALLLTFTVEPM